MAVQRSEDHRLIAGVCGGLAVEFGWTPAVVRILWVILSIVPGSILGGIVVYVLLMVLMNRPSVPGVSPSTPGEAP